MKFLNKYRELEDRVSTLEDKFSKLCFIFKLLLPIFAVVSFASIIAVSYRKLNEKLKNSKLYTKLSNDLKHLKDYNKGILLDDLSFEDFVDSDQLTIDAADESDTKEE